MDAGSSHFDEFNNRLQTSALNATHRAAVLPSDIAFHRSMEYDLAQELDIFSEQVLSLTNKLLGLVSTVDETQAGRGKGKAKLESAEDVVDSFYSLIVDATDQLLERTDICLDNVLGLNKAPAIVINLKDTTIRKERGHKAPTQAGRLEPVIQHAAHLPKPQTSFKKPPDNSDTPWHPTLSHKYNAKVPLGHFYHDPGLENNNAIVSNHPYHYEITHLSYPRSMFTPSTPIQPPSLEDTSATWVATSEDFQIMLSKLKKAIEIAVDLEHHSYRSYAGFLCLMQISSREQDWVVDLLAVRDEVETLNEVFTDPTIVKVFHGAESDIVWLQQNFNVYVVNLFDTFHASKLLEFSQHGLANLLQMYCDFVSDKRYQLADWRIRPLPDDMLRYARSDTHFLLYIYDSLRNALLDRSKSMSSSRSSTPSRSPFVASSSRNNAALLDETLARSAETSLRVYTKEPYDAAEGSGPGGWDTLAKRWNKIALTADGPRLGIGVMQREVYKSVHWWRERVAREEDESTRYVLQNHSLFLIAEQPPADMASLFTLFKPSVPPVVKRRAKELLMIIAEAVKKSLSSTQPNVTESETSNTIQIEQVDKTGTQEDAVMELEAGVKNPDQERREQKNIWGGVTTNKTAPSVSTSRSSLLGPYLSSKSSKAPITQRTSITTGVSSLFGSKDGKLTQKVQRPQTRSNSSHFTEVVTKINRSLVMAPSIPQVVVPPSALQPQDTLKDQIDHISGMQLEIPYVSASQRPTKQAIQEQNETIIVAGQARQKRKRRAGKHAGDLEADTPSTDKNERSTSENTQGGPKTTEHQEPFDFSSIPNILDDGQDTGNGGEEMSDKRRKKQKKSNNKGGNFYGDFPAPPKAHSELKSGNKSYTFK